MIEFQRNRILICTEATSLDDKNVKLIGLRVFIKMISEDV
jgi:hypothetical protein